MSVGRLSRETEGNSETSQLVKVNAHTRARTYTPLLTARDDTLIAASVLKA